jgi:hypothetical protein
MNPIASTAPPAYIEEENPGNQEYQSRQFLSQYFWPIGLQNTVLKSCQKFPIRFMIVDDSGDESNCALIEFIAFISCPFSLGSMIQNDGHRFVPDRSGFACVSSHNETFS